MNTRIAYYLGMKIVRTRGFDRDLKRIGATASDLDALIDGLRRNPEAGDVIKGLRGIRKVRFGLPSRNMGKRGGGRGIYLLIETNDALVLLMAYAKNEKSDLSDADRKALLRVMEELES